MGSKDDGPCLGLFSTRDCPSLLQHIVLCIFASHLGFNHVAPGCFTFTGPHEVSFLPVSLSPLSNRLDGMVDTGMYCRVPKAEPTPIREAG